MKKTKTKTLNEYQLLVQSVQNKRNKKKYTPSYSKKDKSSEYAILMIFAFVVVFMLLITLDHNGANKENTIYDIPTSTKVMSSVELQEAQEEILEEVNDHFEAIINEQIVKKDFFATTIKSYTPNELIGQVARGQLGNKGGQPFWSYWGFKQRVAWCAIFASWCADQLGYIEKGIVPYFASVGAGTRWFIENNLWARGNIEPSPGMYIFFDSDDPEGWGPQDGKADHVGLVEKVEDGYVYCIEGNYKDMVCETKYPIGYYQILGYGTPEY